MRGSTFPSRPSVVIGRNAADCGWRSTVYSLDLIEKCMEKWRQDWKKWNIVEPTEENGYCLFVPELENEQFVLFHATPSRNLESIITEGFRSAADLPPKNGGLSSVSYAKNSSECLTHLGFSIDVDYVGFAVKFKTFEHVKENPSHIYVYDRTIQPEILGYCELKAGFRVS